MKDMTFPFLTPPGMEGISGQLLLSDQQASEDLGRDPSARLCCVPRLNPSRECIITNGPTLPVPQAQLSPNSLAQLASPRGCVCPAIMQPVFIKLLQPHEEKLALPCLSVQDPNHQACRKWTKEGDGVLGG